jgi:hypothetical protein
MKSVLLTSAIYLFFVQTISAQKEKIEYQSIANTTLEEAFPVATRMLADNLNLGVHEFNYGKSLLKTTYYEYYRGISRHRGRWQLSIDEQGTLNVDITDVEWWMSSQDRWEPTTREGLLSKKEYKLRAEFAENLRSKLSEPKTVSVDRDWFFTNLEINSKFFENATDLAGDRWFDQYLNSTRVEWPLTFIDIEKSKDANDFKYQEFFTNAVELGLGSVNYEDNNFFVTKFTNDDANVLKERGSKSVITGYCRILEYNDATGVFYVVLTDELSDDIPSTTLAKQQSEGASEAETSIASVADEIKKLKELLDMEAISKEEYEQEKKKLLNQN